MTYTIQQIKDAWDDYDNKRVLRFLKAGKWETIELNGQALPRIQATRAEQRKLSDVMGFPEFLEEKWKQR